ncbi:MAG TPA: cytochrome C oxidase subunit IV family protein [Ilumatobacter sp.]
MSTDTAHSDDTAHGEAHHSDEHWSDLKYVQLALVLAGITAIEVALSYMVDDLGALFLPLLLILMVIKFFSVVLFFMHLKFDSRLFGLLFYTGLGLAVAVYIAALLTFEFFSP